MIVHTSTKSYKIINIPMEKPEFLTTLCRFLLTIISSNNKQGEMVRLLRRRLVKVNGFSILQPRPAK